MLDWDAEACTMLGFAELHSGLVQEVSSPEQSGPVHEGSWVPSPVVSGGVDPWVELGSGEGSLAKGQVRSRDKNVAAGIFAASIVCTDLACSVIPLERHDQVHSRKSLAGLVNQRGVKVTNSSCAPTGRCLVYVPQGIPGRHGANAT